MPFSDDSCVQLTWTIHAQAEWPQRQQAVLGRGLCPSRVFWCRLRHRQETRRIRPLYKPRSRWTDRAGHRCRPGGGPTVITNRCIVLLSLWCGGHCVEWRFVSVFAPVRMFRRNVLMWICHLSYDVCRWFVCVCACVCVGERVPFIPQWKAVIIIINTRPIYVIASIFYAEIHI